MASMGGTKIYLVRSNGGFPAEFVLQPRSYPALNDCLSHLSSATWLGGTVDAGVSTDTVWVPCPRLRGHVDASELTKGRWVAPGAALARRVPPQTRCTRTASGTQSGRKAATNCGEHWSDWLFRCPTSSEMTRVFPHVTLFSVGLLPMSRNLRQLLPSMTQLLDTSEIAALVHRYGRPLVQPALRDAVEQARVRVDESSVAADREELLDRVISDAVSRLAEIETMAVHPVINGTGILLHTGLGRAPLSTQARTAVQQAAGACLLEVDPESGERIYRGFQVAHQLQVLTGAPDSVVVNNNAGATLLVLQALCQGGEVLISRGQLVEIGGSFRLPEIFETAQVKLREVGATNRTHLKDYETAITENTVAILRVHASNYRITGFASEPSTKDLSEISQNHKLLLLDDIGSGQLQTHESLAAFSQPAFCDSINAGADVVLGSGDKLLGGPQCGIVVGRSDLIGRVQTHPLARCLRVDKLTLAALHATLQQHITGQQDDIPLYRLLNQSMHSLRNRASHITDALQIPHVTVSTISSHAEVGGGTCAGHSIESVAIRLASARTSSDALARRLRLGTPSIWCRTQHDAILIDLRSVDPGDDMSLISGMMAALAKNC
jgi:L-seryl-tRNA(Ser) seleniumtransferase